MFILKEEYRYLYNVSAPYFAKVSRKFDINSRTYIIVGKNSVQYTYVQLSGNITNIISGLTKYNLNILKRISKNDDYLNSIHQLKFLFKMQDAFSFKLKANATLKDTLEYSRHKEIIFNKELFYTNDNKFKEKLTKSLNSYLEKEINKTLEEITKDDIKLLKVLIY